MLGAAGDQTGPRFANDDILRGRGNRAARIAAAAFRRVDHFGHGTSNSFCLPRHGIGLTRRGLASTQQNGPSVNGSAGALLTGTQSTRSTIATMAPGKDTVRMSGELSGKG